MQGLVLILSWIYVLSQALADEVLQVSQWPSALTATRGEQAKLRCTFPPKEPGVKGAVSWQRTSLRDNVTATQVIGLKGRFSLSFPKTFLQEGDGSLLVSDVSWEDAGVYYCKVLIWEQEQEQGNGTQLHVYARPSNPEIYVQVATEAGLDKTLVCKTSGYYPPPVHLDWHSPEMTLSVPEPIEIWESGGIFHSARRLVLPTRFNAVTFTCTVRHVSLPECLTVAYTYYPLEPGMTGYQLVEYLNIIKMGFLLGLTICMLCTVKRKCKPKANGMYGSSCQM